MLEIKAVMLPRRFSSLSAILYVLITTIIVSIVLLFQHSTFLIERTKTDNVPLKVFQYVLNDDATKDTYDSIAHTLKRGKYKTESQFLYSKLLENITVDRFTGSVFMEIHDWEDFTPKNFRSVIYSTRSLNNLQDRFLISGSHICTGPPPFLLIIIPSIFDHFKQRQAIRETWVRATLTNNWPREYINKRVRYLFFVGKHSRFSRLTFNSMQQESSEHEDIVLSDVLDSYRSLTKKIMSALQWVNTYCNKADFILKLDEDTFANIPLILQFISLVASQTTSSKFILGQIHGSETPVVLRQTRWAVSKSEYPFEVYPRYMYGHSYVLSRAAIPSLVDMANHVQFISPEDAYVTGILSKMGNVTRISASCFTVCCADLFDCEVVNNAYVTMTTVETPEDQYRLWKSVVDGKCHPQIAFNHRKRHPNKKPVTVHVAIK